MQRLGRFVRITIIIIVLLVGLIEVVLRVGLTPLYRKAISPAIETKLHCSSHLTRGWASLLGTVGVDNLVIESPEGFPAEPPTLSVGGFQASLKVAEAVQGRFHLPSVTLSDTAIALVRRGDGQLNTAVIRDAATAPTLPPPPTAPTSPSPSPTPALPHSRTSPTSPTPALPPLLVDTLAADIDLIIADYKADPASPFRVDLALQARATDLSTAAFGHTNWATLTLTGAIRQVPDAYKTNLELSLAPLADPLTPSFVLTGEIARIDMTAMGSIQDEIGISSSNVVLRLNLTAEEGHFVKGSHIEAVMMDARLAGKHAAKHPKLVLPPNLSLTIPITGTVAEPACDIKGAIIGSLVKNVGGNLDYILDNTTIKGESLRDKADQEVNRLLKKLKF